MLQKSFNLQEIINLFTSRELVDLIDNDKKTTLKSSLFQKPVSGIYIFWYNGSVAELDTYHRHLLIKGKVSADNTIKEKDKKHDFHRITFDTGWFPEEIKNQFALYVGKSTNIANRFGMHLKMGTSHTCWKEKMLDKSLDHEDQNLPYLRIYSPTTSCQFRSGIELLLKNKSEEEFWEILKHKITFSFLPLDTRDAANTDLNVVERFYLEDYLIGALRPWFNVDSER